MKRNKKIKLLYTVHYTNFVDHRQSKESLDKIYPFLYNVGSSVAVEPRSVQGEKKKMHVFQHEIEVLAEMGAPNVVVIAEGKPLIDDVVQFAQANHATYRSEPDEMFLVQMPGRADYQAMNRAHLAIALA